MTESLHFDPNQLHLYTYRRATIVDYTLDDANLEDRCPLDNGRHDFSPLRSLGRLDDLPLEILTRILLLFDIPTLTAFRRVNRRATSIVDSLQEYGMIFEHCPSVLRAIVSIDARHYDCATLYKTLSTTKCQSCNLFGGYLYLLTCKRVCYFCFTSRPEYLPMSATYAAKHTSLLRRQVNRLPHILSLPGRYTAFGNGQLANNRIKLFDRDAVRPWVPAEAPDERRETPDRMTRDPRRFMAIISAPYFDFSSSTGQSADWGYFCNACRHEIAPGVQFRIKFTKNGIIDHLKRHGARLAKRGPDNT